MNTRPLTHVPSNIDDERTLSPANFLYPYMITPSSTTILPPIPTSGDFLRGSWCDVRRLAEIFRQRWVKEYLKTLSKRTKWLKSTQPLYDGQIVLLSDSNSPREEWKTGRIQSCVSQDQTHGRNYMVRMADGKIFQRHIRQLIPLETEYEEDETVQKE